jgi:hypothetical protein
MPLGLNEMTVQTATALAPDPHKIYSQVNARVGVAVDQLGGNLAPIE